MSKVSLTSQIAELRFIQNNRRERQLWPRQMREGEIATHDAYLEAAIRTLELVAKHEDVVREALEKAMKP